ncbi:MAG TPA: sulfotransferase family 2 domain-containing protein [Pontiella sp.]
MAYIPDKKLLFIHIPKNAGKSIEVGLGMASSHALNVFGKRSLINRAFTSLQRKSSNPDARKHLHGSLDITLCAQHLTLQEIRLLNLIPEQDLKTLRIFAVCRNPWDRALSSFRHFIGVQDLTPVTFESFCESWYDMPPSDHNTLAHRRRQIDFIINERGIPAVQHVLRFENLASEFSELCRVWNLGDLTLPCIGRQHPSCGYAEMYTDKSRKLIAERFAEDIEYFNYRFES